MRMIAGGSETAGRTPRISSFAQSNSNCSVVGRLITWRYLRLSSGPDAPGDVEVNLGRVRDGAYQVAGHDAAELAVGDRVGAGHLLPEQASETEHMEVLDDLRIELLLGHSGALAVSLEKRLRIGSVQVGIHGVIGVVADVLPRIADAAELPVDHHGPVCANQHVRRLAVAVHQSQGHGLGTVGPQASGGVAKCGTAVRPAAAEVVEHVDQTVDVLVPVGRTGHVGWEVVDRRAVDVDHHVYERVPRRGERTGVPSDLL